MTNVLSTTAGDVVLETYHLRLGERAWRVLHAGAIISIEDEQQLLSGAQSRFPYGIVLWPSAIALAHELASRPLSGRSVLELGAGTGLPGIVAASFGAQVVQTERQEVALHVARLNAKENGLASIQHSAADWTAWEDQSLYDFIVAADVLYADFMHAHLRRIFESNLAPGGTVLLADPFRKASLPFLEELEAGGWRVTMSKWTVGIKPPERPVGVYELTRLSSRRG